MGAHFHPDHARLLSWDNQVKAAIIGTSQQSAGLAKDFAGSRYADIDVTDRRHWPVSLQRLDDAASSHLWTAQLRALVESADLEMQIAEAQERAAAAQERAALAR